MEAALKRNPTAEKARGVPEADQLGGGVSSDNSLSSQSQQALQEHRREHLLALLRSGSLRLKLALNELDVLGLSLKLGMIQPFAAVQWLRHEGLDGWVDIPAIYGTSDPEART